MILLKKNKNIKKGSGTLNKHESKYFNTAVRIDEAFLELLNKKEIEYITVKEICNKASINRSTFYLHYETINDLLLETIEYIYSKFQNYFILANANTIDINASTIEEIQLIKPKYLIPWLNFIKDNKKLFQTFLMRNETLKMNENMKFIQKKVIHPILARFQIDKTYYDYISLFYLEGIIAIVKYWIKCGCQMAIEEVADLIKCCVYGDYDKLKK